MTNNSIIYTNKAKCLDCNRCVRYCPVKAIKVENGQARVIEDNCILCGTCVQECPQNAKMYRKDIDKALNLIKSGKKVVVSVAPSFVSFFSKEQSRRLPSALRLAGFNLVSETAIGAYSTAIKSAEFISKNPNKSYLFTSCPAFVNYIEKYQHLYVNNMVQVVSPMIAHAKLLKNKYGKDVSVIFVGPCIAKKGEAERREYNLLVDCVLTFDELLELFEIVKIDIEKCEESSFDETIGNNAKIFPIEGGLLSTAKMNTDLISSRYIAVSGFDEIADVLRSVYNTKKNYYIEPMMCKGGCINGPSMPKNTSIIEKKDNVLEFWEQNKNDKPTEILECGDAKYRKYERKEIFDFSEEQISEVLKQTGKITKEQELNCGACGYNSCRDKAIAVLQGKAEIQMCIPFMKRFAEEKNEIVVKSSPNGIVALDQNLQILSMNPSFKKMFACSDSIIGKHIGYLIDPEPFEKLFNKNNSEIRQIVKYPNYNLICHQICYTLSEEKNYIGIFVDITDVQINKEKLNEYKTETITKAQELIEHQIKMAQELAKFLGDNTAKGEMLLNKLIDVISK